MDFSNLGGNSRRTTSERGKINLNVEGYTHQEVESSKAVVDKFLNKNAKSKTAKKDTHVFSRLHNQAMIKQK